jgi:diguanylate cyclase (GGDEF)-like protein
VGAAGAAGSPGPVPWAAAFERIGIDQGLSQSVVTSIYQDELGFLWFGTQEGLNRYDGRSFKVYRHDPGDPESLSSSSIEVIAGDGEGRLWLGTDDGGVNILDPRTGDITVLRHDPSKARSLSHDRVLDIAFGPDGSAWLGTEAGLDRVRGKGATVERIGNRSESASVLAGKTITSVLAGGDGKIWAGTRESGLYVLEADGNVVRYGAAEPDARRLAGNQVTDLAFDEEGNVWVTTLDGGLDRIGDGGITVLSTADESLELPDTSLTAIHVEEDGSLLVGSDDGYLYRISPDLRLLARHRYAADNPDSIARGSIEDIYVDRTGVLWVGSYTGGISKSKSLSGKVTHGILGSNDSRRLPDKVVRAFWVDEEPRQFWIGTNGGLARAGPGAERYEVFRHEDGNPLSLSNDVVYSVLRRQNGELWVGTRSGLNRFRPKTGNFERYLKSGDRGLPDNRVRELVEDAEGRLWVGTEGGLARYEDARDRFRVYRSSARDSNSLSSDEVTALFADDEGFIWVGTNIAGLNRFDPESGSFRHYEAGPDGLSHHSVWDVRRIDDTVWVGTFSGGLNRIDLPSGTVTRYLERDGLANNVVYQVVPDGRGRLWLSTNAGISVFHPDTGKFLNYNPRDGLQNYEFNSNAGFRDKEGRLYFGGVDGMDIIDAPAVERTSTDAVAALTGFQLFNQPVASADDERIDMDASIEYADRLTLDYQAKVFSIGLGALHFVNPDTNHLRYRLDGLHDGWLESNETLHYVTFNSLAPGDYRLRVQASGRGTEWGPERVLDIRVTPPPWRSPGAYAAYALTALLLLAALVRAYWRRIGAERRQIEKLNAMVADRTIELEALNEQLKVTNQRLEVATRRDPLTQLANRRELLDWLPREQAAALRAYRDWAGKGATHDEPTHARLCFLAVDIDDFKQINDTWGHLVGDRILYSFAQRLKDHCRSSDLAVRWGGEEFLLVMRATGPEGARYLAERIRRTVQTRPVTLDSGEEVRMTCSIGFACYPFSTRHPDVGDWEDIVGLADAGLYAAKRAGKNAWIGIGCPDGLSSGQVNSLLRDPKVRQGHGDRAVFWRSG